MGDDRGVGKIYQMDADVVTSDLPSQYRTLSEKERRLQKVADKSNFIWSFFKLNMFWTERECLCVWGICIDSAAQRGSDKQSGNHVSGVVSVRTFFLAEIELPPGDKASAAKLFALERYFNSDSYRESW